MAVAFTAAGGGLQSIGAINNPLAFVQQASNALVGATSITATFPGAQNPNNTQDTNVVFVSCSIAGDISSVVDSSGNTYTLIESGSDTTGLYNLYAYACVFILPATAGSNTVTVNFSAAVTASLVISEWQGVGGVDVNVVTANGTTVNSTATLQSQYPNAVVVTGAIGNATGTPTPGTGFTTLASGNVTSLAYICEYQQFTGSPQAVTCAATAVGVTTWATVAIALWQTRAPNVVPFTFCCFFKYTGTGNYNILQVDDGGSTGGANFFGPQMNVNGVTVNRIDYVSGDEVTLLFGETLVASTWYFAAVTIANTGVTGAECYLKEVGAPVCTRTTSTNNQTVSATAVRGVYIAVFNNAANGNAQPNNGEVLVGGMAGVKMWTKVLSQDEIEFESQSIYPHPSNTAGIYLVLPLTTAQSWSDESGVSNLQFLPYGGTGVFATTDDPPVPRRVNTKLRKFAKMSNNDVLFFNGPFVSSGEAAALQSDMNPLAQYRRERRPLS